MLTKKTLQEFLLLSSARLWYPSAPISLSFPTTFPWAASPVSILLGELFSAPGSPLHL